MIFCSMRLIEKTTRAYAAISEHHTSQDSRDFRDDRIPVDGDPRHGSEGCLSGEPQKGRAPVTTFLEPINRYQAMPGIDEPYFRPPAPLVGGNLHGPVISCCAR